jgi:DNA uptake protein ComE-like DNA-binding protein
MANDSPTLTKQNPIQILELTFNKETAVKSSKHTILAAMVITVLGLGFAHQASATIDCHLKLDGVKGERTKTPTKGDCPVVKAIDINVVTQSDLAAINSVGPQVAQAIVTERVKGTFKDAQDFSARVCKTTSVNFGTTNIVIGQNNFEPRGNGSPKTGGFKCVAQQNSYSFDNQAYSYKPQKSDGSLGDSTHAKHKDEIGSQNANAFNGGVKGTCATGRDAKGNCKD